MVAMLPGPEGLERLEMNSLSLSCRAKMAAWSRHWFVCSDTCLLWGR